VTWTQRVRHIPRSVVYRAVRIAIVAPGTFAIGDKLLDNPTTALFASLGSISMLLFADFGGSNSQRVKSHVALVVAGLVLVTIGTVSSSNIWVATSVSVVVSFLILFFGIVSSVVAGAQSALLLSILLPITFQGPIDSIPSRLVGWLLAGVASLLAILLVPPRKSREPLPRLTRDACLEFGGRLHALASATDEQGHPKPSTTAISSLRVTFFSAPYRPAGLSRAARSIVQIAEQLILLQSTVDHERALNSDEERAAIDVAGEALEACAALLGASHPDPSALEVWRPRLQQARDVANQAVVDAIPGALNAPRRGSQNMDRDALVALLEPSFLVQDVTRITDEIVERTIDCGVARTRTWWQHLLDLSPVNSARVRLGAHLNWRSVWLHNSIRGALGFGLTVFLADLLGVQHAFWVVFGTLAILRSNASNTGQTAVRALLGTAIGLIVGLPVVLLIGDHTTISWILLPLSFAFGALASAVFFAAGQAGFTFTLLLLFSIVGPVGLDFGLVRITDVALGCAVAVVVTLLLWPRGATANMNRALASAFDLSARYVGEAVRFSLLRGHASLTGTPPVTERTDAANAARRLDDASRQFLAERGAKGVDLAQLTSLIVAVAVLRRTADAINDIWLREDSPPSIAQSRARAQILFSQAELVGWFRQAAGALMHDAPVPPPLSSEETMSSRLLDALQDDFTEGDERQAVAAVKLLWTYDQLRSARVVGADILPAISSAAEASGKKSAWFVGSSSMAPA
jgi:uncharacterized membrane protein YccC